MNDFLNKMERKYGRYAIRHLTGVMIAFFVAGYVIEMVNSSVLDYMTLDIYAVLHGQIWRVITWLLTPPSSLSIWTIIMLLFYLSIGTSLERAWGDFRYNAYIIGGMIISLAAAFITYFIFLLIFPGGGAAVGNAIGQFFSTYYICMSLLLAYAATFPDAVVLVMFVIPVRMKYFGWIYGAFMAYDAITYIRYAVSTGNALYFIGVIAMAASLVTFLIFYLSTRNRVHLSREQKARQRAFRESMRRGGASATSGRSRNRYSSGQGRTGTYGNGRPSGGPSSGAGGGSAGNIVGITPRHRCEVCGRTDITNPELEFRFCTKCAGAHEYCMDHLYTHQHILVDPNANQQGNNRRTQG